MPSEQAMGLYGAPRPKKKLKSSAPDSSSMTFASHLTSLMSGTSRKPATASGKEPSRARKDDIFAAHHRTKKAKRETVPMDVGAQKHQTSADIGGVDKDILYRSRRKMEQKAQIYAAMKRGEYVDPRAKRYGNSAMAEALADEHAPLVDFDRKWAEQGGEDPDGANNTSSDEGSESQDEQEQVEYTDEFGRTRTGTRAQTARILRQQRAAHAARAELSEMRGRPVLGQHDDDDDDGTGAQSQQVIYGDTVQVAAFNPDHTIAEQMAALAAKRDRSLTPPPDTHYDASKEIRSKGVGFYQFSQDNEGREREMHSLLKERADTERRGKEREDRRAKKERDLMARRQLLRDKRTARQADAFLSSLDLSAPDSGGGGGDQEAAVAAAATTTTGD